MRAAPRTTDGKPSPRWTPLLERLEQRETPAVTAGLSQTATWFDLGPTTITNGQVRNIGANNTVNGAVQAMVAHPTNPNIMFAAGPNGGVWRTVDAQSATPTWQPISDNVSSLSVSSLAIDPDNPDRLMVGIGGTADGAGVDDRGVGNAVVRGDLIGVLYSENAVSAATPTWRVLNNNLAGKNVVDMVVRSQQGANPGFMLVATDAGLYRSTDNGVTFNNAFQASTDSGVSYFPRNFAEGVFDLVENPRLRNQYYIATKRLGNDPLTRQIWRSDNFAVSWQRVTDPIQMQLNDRTVAVKLAMRDAAVNDNQIYVAVSNDLPTTTVEQNTPGVNGPQGGLVRYAWDQRRSVVTSIVWSTNQGGQWFRMDDPRQLTGPSPTAPPPGDLDQGQRIALGATYNGGGVQVNGGLVQVITNTPHRLRTGDRVYLRNVLQYQDPGPSGPEILIANSIDQLGYYDITVVNATTFTLNGVPDPAVQIDSISAFWQRVVGVNPGEKGQFLEMVASPTASNLVYMGGDFAQFRFSAAGPQPTSFTGSVWVGDRFRNPTAPLANGTSGANQIHGRSTQWASLTDNQVAARNGALPGTVDSPWGTLGSTSPGGDTREMLVDANNNLWVATGTGIYRRRVNFTNNADNTKDTENNTAQSNWTFVSNNLEMGTFWSVSWDNRRSAITGATQDTGRIHQTTAGSLTYDAYLSTAQRNALTDQEYAFSTVVDDTSTAGVSYRFAAGSSFAQVSRQVFIGSDTADASSNFLNFGSSSTPLTPLSGILAADTALAQDNTAVIKLALNRNNQTRGVYALTNLYEDSDPNGVTGAIVRAIQPAELAKSPTSRFSALDYGGRRFDPVLNQYVQFNQILYAGTDAGELFVRGEAGPIFANITPPGTGRIWDVKMDPDDWRHVFVIQGQQIWESRNGGQAGSWVDRTANLLSVTPDPLTGLPAAATLTTQVRTIALYDPAPGVANVGVANDVVLLAGGRGGVFRRSVSVCGTTDVWSKYGSGMPNSVVTSMEVDGNRLVAGTFGRGVWTIPDVSATLSQTLYLDIIGDAGDNSISITADPLDPNAVIVSDGGALNQRFSFGQFDQIRVFGLGGADTLYLSGGGSANGLRFVNYPVFASMGGEPGDQIVLNAASATADIQASVAATTIGSGPGDTLFSGCGSLTYFGLDRGQLTLLTGSGNDTHFLVNGQLPPTIALDGGAGNDTYYMYSSSTANVFVYDQPGGSNAVVAFVPAGQTAYVDAPNRVLVAGNLVVTASPNVTNLLLDAQGAGSSVVWTGSAANDYVYLMQDPGFPTGWSQLGWTSYNVRFRNMNAATVNLLGGSDILQVDSNGPGGGGSTQFMTYTLTANMGGDANDILLVDSSSSTAAIRAGVSGSVVGTSPGSDTLFGGIGYIVYTGLTAGGLYLYTGAGNDQLVFDGAANLFAVVDAGGGSDQVWTLGTAGNDVSNAVGNSLTTNAMRVALALNTEQFVVTSGGGFDQLFTSGTTGNDALSLTQTGSTSGTVGGIPVPTTFFGVQAVNVNGAGGSDNLAWVDGSNLAWGTPVNPSTGLVFAPTGPASGSFTLAGGTTTRFSNVAGGVTANGDPGNTNTRDVIAVLGVSSAALGSQFGEVTAPNGSDAIAATDASVTVTNASMGPLKPIGFAFTSGGFNSFSTVFVRGGNEAGTGDTFTATTTTRTNLLLDGGNPTSAPGDSITITTNGPAASTQVNNPLLGPPHTRVTSRADQSAVGHLNFESVTVVATDPANPGGPPLPSLGSQKSDLFVAGTDVGASGEVRAYNLDGSLRHVFVPFPGFTGGVRVAVGDVTGDGKSDVVVAAGAGGGPAVKVYNGQTGAEVRSFFAFDSKFTGGVSVAVGYFDSDRFADIVVGAGPGGGPAVKRFDGASGAEVQSFFAYAPGFTGGVNVAAGDVNGDGLAEYITGTATGVPHVRVLNGQSTEELYGLYAFDPASSNGVNVAAGDITGDGIADLITGAGPGGTTTVRVYDGATTGLIRDFVVNDPTIPGQPPIPVTSGVRVAATDFDGDGLAEVVTGRGRGSRPFAQVIKVSTLSGGLVQPSLTTLLAVNTFGDAYSNGIFVGS